MNYAEFLNNKKSAVKFGRKAVLIELKPSYYRILIDNMKRIEHESNKPDLFTVLETVKDENTI